MPYCSWCHLDSDTDDFCVWCKRPFSAGPSLFNLPKKNDIHFLASEDDSSDLQVPVFAVLGVIVFVAIIGFAWINLRRNVTVAQTPPQVTDVGELNQTQPRPLNDQQQFRALPGAGGVNPAVPINRGSLAQGTPTVPASGHGPDEIWKNGQPLNMNLLRLDLPTQIVRAPAGSTIYFESAKFQIQTDSKGVARLIGDIVVVNDRNSDLLGGKLWLKIGGTKLILHRFKGKVEAPQELGPITVPSDTSLECYVYGEGFNKSMNINLPKSLGLDAEVAGASLSLDRDISS
jgi:hypothetical protein